MSDRVRIYELARKMNLPAPVLIDACRELGYDVKSHSSTIDGHVVGLVIAHLGKKKQAPEKAEPKTSAPTAKPPAASGTRAAAKAAAAPPPPVVKPRVLARYRKEDRIEAAEPVAEHAPPEPIAAPPEPSPAVRAQAEAAAAARAQAEAAAARAQAEAAAAAASACALTAGEGSGG